MEFTKNQNQHQDQKEEEKEDAVHRIKTYQPLTPRQASSLRKYFDNGYEKLPPFTLAEVECFEREIGSKLPPFLRTYILYVSREISIRKDAYQTNINLRIPLHHDIPRRRHNSKFTKLRQEDRCKVEDIIREFAVCDESDENKKPYLIDKMIPDVFDGCLTIGDTDDMGSDGDFQRYYLVVKGDNIGMVLTNVPDEDFMYCGHIDDIIKKERFEVPIYSEGILEGF